MKKASVNGQPALLDPATRRFALLPGFADYVEVESVGIVGAVNDSGQTISLSWAPLTDADRVHVEQDLTLS